MLETSFFLQIKRKNLPKFLRELENLDYRNEFSIENFVRATGKKKSDELKNLHGDGRLCVSLAFASRERGGATYGKARS